MTGFRPSAMTCVLAVLVAVNTGSPAAQERGARSGGPAAAPPTAVLELLNQARGRGGADQLAGPVVAGAPFSADATTTVTQTLGDGTRIEQRTNTKLFRDATGRMRREQTVVGLDRLSPSQPQTTISIDTVPGDPRPYVLDPVNRTARRGGPAVLWFTRDSRELAVASATPVGAYFNNTGERRAVRAYGDALSPQQLPIPADLKPTEEQLGTRQIDGVKATGRRTTTIIPTDRIGNDKPIYITNEQWESPELRLLIYSRFSDPRTGVVEYRMTNINRSEPRADLFTVPSDYTVVNDAPGLRTGGDGQRGGGGRGGRGN